MSPKPTPCFSGHQIEELSLTLPPGRDIELLPKGKVKLPVAVCRDEIREKLAEAIAEIRGDYRARIALKPPAH
jgi:hypothetical protein